jgi:hypothetical protein
LTDCRAAALATDFLAGSSQVADCLVGLTQADDWLVVPVDSCLADSLPAAGSLAD